MKTCTGCKSPQQHTQRDGAEHSARDDFSIKSTAAVVVRPFSTSPVHCSTRLPQATPYATAFTLSSPIRTNPAMLIKRNQRETRDETGFTSHARLLPLPDGASLTKSDVPQPTAIGCATMTARIKMRTIKCETATPSSVSQPLPWEGQIPARGRIWPKFHGTQSYTIRRMKMIKNPVVATARRIHRMDCRVTSACRNVGS